MSIRTSALGVGLAAMVAAVVFLTGTHPAVSAPGPSSAWAPIAPLPRSLYDSPRFVAPDGRLFVLGTNSSNPGPYYAYWYDAGTNTWTTATTPPQTGGGAFPSLGGGGFPSLGDGTYLNIHKCDVNTDIFDPVTDSWSDGPPRLTQSRVWMSSRLADGRIYVAGRVFSGDCFFGTATALTAEIFDPATDTWSGAALPPCCLSSELVYLGSTPLIDGRLLFVWNQGNDAAVYDPVADAWTMTAAPVPATTSRAAFTMNTLSDGRVLLTGGFTTANMNFFAHGDTWLYDPVAGTWTPGPPLLHKRFNHCAVLLDDGRLMIPSIWAEVFDPVANAWSMVNGSGFNVTGTALTGELFLATSTCVIFPQNPTYSGEIYGPDSDGDGYNDWWEGQLGEDRNQYCGIMRSDITHDGIVNSGDLGRMASLFAPPPQPPQYNQNSDAIINSGDFGIMASRFNKTAAMCP